VKETNCKWIDGLDDNGDPYCSYPEYEGVCLLRDCSFCSLKGGVI